MHIRVEDGNCGMIWILAQVSALRWKQDRALQSTQWQHSLLSYFWF